MDTNEQLTTRDILVRLDTKVDGLVTTAVDMELRMRAIEKWKYALPGSVVTAALALIIALGHGGNF